MVAHGHGLVRRRRDLTEFVVRPDVVCLAPGVVGGLYLGEFGLQCAWGRVSVVYVRWRVDGRVSCARVDVKSLCSSTCLSGSACENSAVSTYGGTVLRESSAVSTSGGTVLRAFVLVSRDNCCARAGLGFSRAMRDVRVLLLQMDCSASCGRARRATVLNVRNMW